MHFMAARAFFVQLSPLGMVYVLKHLNADCGMFWCPSRTPLVRLSSHSVFGL